MRHINCRGFSGSVKFVCRYRGENTYELTEKTGTSWRVSLADDGTATKMPYGCPLADTDLLGSVAEYERAEHAEYLEWCKSTGFSPMEESPICRLQFA